MGRWDGMGWTKHCTKAVTWFSAAGAIQSDVQSVTRCSPLPRLGTAQRIHRHSAHQPPAPKLRHSARSRGIHFSLPTHQPEKPAPFALHYGYCDFAQYDGVGRATVSPSPDTPSRLPTQSSRLSTPPPIISGVPAEPQHRHSARSRGIHLRLPWHQPENPTPFALHYGYCDFAQYDGVGRATVSPSPDTILPSFDTPSHHSGSTRRTPTPSFRAQSRNPSLPANASTRKASALCTPLWILRLRAV